MIRLVVQRSSPSAVPHVSTQARFFQLVCSRTLLVGHSLENDLKALRVVHARVLDTAVLFPHPKAGRHERGQCAATCVSSTLIRFPDHVLFRFFAFPVYN